jgi:hypothetical protein
MPAAKRPLAVVNEPVEVALDADEKDLAGDRALGLREILREHMGAADGGPPAPPDDSRQVPPERIPFCIRLTSKQLLAAAEDADLRAQMLQWSNEEMQDGSEVLRKVTSLHRVAIDLHTIAARLQSEWAEATKRGDDPIQPRTGEARPGSPADHPDAGPTFTVRLPRARRRAARASRKPSTSTFARAYPRTFPARW